MKVDVNLKQASIALKQGKSMIIAGLAESKKDHAIELLAKLKVGMDELQIITEDRKREAVVPKQKELLQYVGGKPPRNEEKCLKELSGSSTMFLENAVEQGIITCFSLKLPKDTSNGMSIEFEEKETGIGRKKRYGHVDSAKLKFEVAKKVCGLRFEVSVAMGFRTLYQVDPITVLGFYLLDLICPIMYLPAADQGNGNVNVFILMHVGVEVAAGSATLVAFWSTLGKETRHSLLKMDEEDFMERLMYMHIPAIDFVKWNVMHNHFIWDGTAYMFRIVVYVKGTLDLGLHLYASSTTSLVGYTDADWTGCPSTRSAEAEYRGVANVVAETAWLRNILRELHSPLSTATLVYCDNVSAVYMSANPVQHQRMKHVEIDIHFDRDTVTAGQVRVLHVPSRSSLSVRHPPAPNAGAY
ncbi:ribonuclease H-like domain-containing protein [Tanacetum coccineum]|uniref:Ribonuclease H-like domain-containing protein n=1 Tax=Tanacetum coccineum TaxID=301880 RepID=A0ABQ5CHS9_9ASTR